MPAFARINVSIIYHNYLYYLNHLKNNAIANDWKAHVGRDANYSENSQALKKKPKSEICLSYHCYNTNAMLMKQMQTKMYFADSTRIDYIFA